jgi:hypothetical protein
MDLSTTERYIIDVDVRNHEFHIVRPVFADIITLVFMAQSMLMCIAEYDGTNEFDRETTKQILEAMHKVTTRRSKEAGAPSIKEWKKRVT